MEVHYKPIFIRQLNKFEGVLREEAIEKIELFKNRENHRQLRVHKLKGRLRDRHSFSVNYKFRIVFSYLSKNEVVLLAIGDHEVYEK